MGPIFSLLFLMILTGNCLTPDEDVGRHERFKRIVGGREAALPPVDDPVVYVPKEGNFAKVFGSRQGIFPNSYYRFTGLRYAEPPVGKYRFQRPKKLKLTGDISGLKYGPPCVQPSPNDPSKVVGSEDCLYLNVYTPRLPDSGTLLPVIFWIHGGGFRRGSAAQYGGGYLTRRDVVVVTVQYRLGVFGFISGNEKDLPGNVALFDLAAAADWVKTYIEFFGGDPSNIIPTGQGSGASTAVFMGLSNVTQGRAKGMIAMSGSPLSPFAIDDSPRETSRKIAEKNGCPYTSTLEMVKCLRQIPAEKLVLSETELEQEEISIRGIDALGRVLTPAPVVEGPNDFRFLPFYIEEDPQVSIDLNHIPKIPLLTGVTKHETAGAVSGKLRTSFISNLKKIPNYLQEVLLPQLVERNKKRFYSLKSLAKNPLNILTGNYLFSTTKSLKDSLSQIIEATSDALFNFPAYQTSKAWSERNLPTFFYSFDHVGKLKGVRHLLRGTLFVNDDEDEEQAAATHGSDLPYIFDLRSLDGTPFDFHNESTPLDPEDEKVRNNLLDLISNFAKNSDQIMLDFANGGKKMASGFPNFISILPESSLGEHFRQCQMSLWSGIQTDEPCSPLAFVMNPFVKGVEEATGIITNLTRPKPALGKILRG